MPNVTLRTIDESSSRVARSSTPLRCRSPRPAPQRAQKERKPVTLRALCHHCNELFELSDLYAADPADADRCPTCAEHLGSAGLGHTTFRIERHLKAFGQALRDLAENPGDFTVDTALIRDRALAAIEQLDQPADLHTSTRIASAARR